MPEGYFKLSCDGIILSTGMPVIKKNMIGHTIFGLQLLMDYSVIIANNQWSINWFPIPDYPWFPYPWLPLDVIFDHQSVMSGLIYGGYYMAVHTEKWSFSLSVQKYFTSQGSKRLHYFLTQKRNFVSPSCHVIYLFYKHQWR